MDVVLLEIWFYRFLYVEASVISKTVGDSSLVYALVAFFFFFFFHVTTNS